MTFNVFEYEDNNGAKPSGLITEALFHYVLEPAKGKLLLSLSTKAQVLEHLSVLKGDGIGSLRHPPVGLWDLNEPPFHLLYSHHKIRLEVYFLYFYEGTDLKAGINEAKRRVQKLYP
jgi:hypothetical protein